MNSFSPVPFLPAVACTVGSPQPAFTAFTPPPVGVEGEVYGGFWVVPNPGADGTFTYSGLPSGLSGSASGVITGTPAGATAGSHSVTITLTSGAGKTVSQIFTIVITA